MGGKVKEMEFVFIEKSVDYTFFKNYRLQTDPEDYRLPTISLMETRF